MLPSSISNAMAQSTTDFTADSTPTEWRISRHLIAAVRCFVQGNGVERLICIATCGVKRNREIIPNEGVRNKFPNFRRMERADLTMVTTLLDLCRSVSFLCQFYCATDATNNGDGRDCLIPSLIKEKIEKNRSSIMRYFESLDLGFI